MQVHGWVLCARRAVDLARLRTTQNRRSAWLRTACRAERSSRSVTAGYLWTSSMRPAARPDHTRRTCRRWKRRHRRHLPGRRCRACGRWHGRPPEAASWAGRLPATHRTDTGKLAVPARPPPRLARPRAGPTGPQRRAKRRTRTNRWQGDRPTRLPAHRAQRARQPRPGGLPRSAPDHGVRDLVSAGQGRVQQPSPEP